MGNLLWWLSIQAQEAAFLVSTLILPLTRDRILVRLLVTMLPCALIFSCVKGANGSSPYLIGLLCKQNELMQAQDLEPCLAYSK